MSTSVYTGLNPFNFFAKTFCRSTCEMFLMYAVIAVFMSLSVLRYWKPNLRVSYHKCTATFRTHYKNLFALLGKESRFHCCPSRKLVTIWEGNNAAELECDDVKLIPLVRNEAQWCDVAYIMVTDILDPHKQEILHQLNDYIWTCIARTYTKESVAIFREQSCTSMNLYYASATYS
jgi:hypothetical protein